jgi:hypothetical protein
MKSAITRMLPLIDLMLLPFVYLSAGILKRVRRVGVHKLPNCKNALLDIGVFPIRNHYYEPKFDYRDIKEPFSKDRNIPGIDWNVQEQLELLSAFSYAHELADLPREKPEQLGYYLENNNFKSGDAEYWYQIIRTIKPRRIIEIGSGNSTLMAIRAISANQLEDSAYQCEQVCIEPYEMSWLENTGVSVVRRKVEDMSVNSFPGLKGMT